MQSITLRDMPPDSPSVSRSFRLSKTTADLLDKAAASSPESRNAIADRLLGEALRAQRHPLIEFRTGAAGFREPALKGTRLKVRQIISTFLDEGRSVEGTAEYFSLPEAQIRAVVSYYAEFRDEIDADHAQALAEEEDLRTQWLREQELLG